MLHDLVLLACVQEPKSPAAIAATLKVLTAHTEQTGLPTVVATAIAVHGESGYLVRDGELVVLTQKGRVYLAHSHWVQFVAMQREALLTTAAV